MQEDAVQRSLQELSLFFVGEASSEETLQRVVDLTRVGIPQAEMVGITMMVDGRPRTGVFNHPDAPEID